MMFTGSLASVPMLYNRVPPRNSMIGRLARNVLSNTAVVLLYSAAACITSIWNQRFDRDHALRSGLSNAIVI